MMFRLRFLVLCFSIFCFGVLQAQSQIESLYIQNIDNEVVKAKLKYNSENPELFADIQDVITSLRADNTIPIEYKSKAYDVFYNIVQDINSNLYADRKVKDQYYQKVVREFPSAVFYLQMGKLDQYLLTYPQKAFMLAPYVYLNDGGKELLQSLGESYPKEFYQNIDDLSKIKNFNSTFIQLFINYPSFWVQYLDKSPIIADAIASSKDPAVKKILYIKKNVSPTSNLMGFLHEIIINGFNDTHEVQFTSNQKVLLKMLMNSIISDENYGKLSALDLFSVYDTYMVDQFHEMGKQMLYLYSVGHDLVFLMNNVNELNNSEIASIIGYLKEHKEDEELSEQIINNIPQKLKDSFYSVIEKKGMKRNFALILPVNLASNLMMTSSADENQFPEENKDWISNSFKSKKDKSVEKVANNSNEIASASSTNAFKLNKSQMALLQWTRNLNRVDSNIANIFQSAIGPRFEEYLSRYQPQIILNNRKKLADSKDFNKIIERVTLNAPLLVKNYLSNSDDPVTKAVYAAQDSVSKKTVEIFSMYKFNTKAYALMDLILKEKLSIQRADEISKNEFAYLKKLMAITIKKNPLGIHSVEEEQNIISLKYIRNINDHPSEGHPHLQEISSLSPQELYSLMVLGKEEIFQFTFNHLYKYFITGLGSDNLYNFIPKVNDYKFRDFCVLMANFDKFSNLIYYNSTEEEVQSFMNHFIDLDLQDINCIDEAANICEFINNCEDPRIQLMVQTRIKYNYDQHLSKKEPLGMAIYSLLASNIGHRALINQSWYEQMEEKYAQHTLSYINVNDLKNKNNKIVEVCYFYNDADGISSFNSYIASFKRLPYWYIQDLGSYYYISSLAGNDYEIFANKPAHEEVGQRTIREYLTVNDLEPTIVVHRGHSYHSQKTIDQMVGNPKFIFMGSCGGYYKIQELLLRSPNAQILSTKQVGTMSINDPMLVHIHEMLRRDNNIDWPRFWSEQQANLGSNSNFKMYVPPHKNNGALFINALFKVVGY